MGNTNYMDYFKSPEDYIVCMLTSRSKSQNAVPKEVLVSYAYSQGIKVTRSMTKKDIFMALKEKNSLKDIALELSIGVSSNSFQMKFGLSHNEVKRMARLGFIQREFDRKNQSSRPKKPSCILGTEQTEGFLGRKE